MSLSSNFPAIRPSLLLDFQKSRAVDPRITFTRASTATYFDEDGILQSALANVPRIDFNPSTLVCNGLLIEEQRTNSIRNNTMVGAVAGTPGTNPTNWDITVSPSGITTEIVGTGVEDGITYIDVRYFGTGSGSASPQIRPETTTGIVAAAGQTWTASYYLRIVGGSTTGLSAFSQIWQERDAAGVSLNTVVVTISAPTTAALKTQRSILTRTLTDAGTARLTNRIQFTCANGVAVDITLRIGLPQLELGAFATSVIPTTTTALTRNTDVAIMTGTNFSSWYNASEGTLYADFVLRQTNAASAQMLASINDNSPNNRFTLTVAASSNLFLALRNTSGAGLLQTSTANAAIIGSNKGALAISTGASIVGNGGTVATNASYAAPVVTQIQIGNQLGAGYFNGTIQRIAYYPTRLADTTLQALTG
jgi:hypothetical protein